MILFYAIYIKFYFIYIYELAVRFENMLISKNLAYDHYLYFVIHYEITYIDAFSVVYGLKELDREYITKIIKEYVHTNKFVDKENFDHFNTMHNEYKPSKMLYKFKDKIPTSYYIEILLIIFIIIITTLIKIPI